jgi:hypothetical protein
MTVDEEPGTEANKARDTITPMINSKYKLNETA